MALDTPVPATPVQPARSASENPVLDPQYVGPNAAAAVLASDSLVRAYGLSVLPPDPAALVTLNFFLDHVVLLFLSRARSSLIGPLRTATRSIFKNQLAEDAIAEAETELRSYIRTPEEEVALLSTSSVNTSNVAFDPAQAWQMARVRCMVYSSLGEIEEADILNVTPEQHSLFSSGGPSDPSDLIPPIATIFLTSILEFFAEHALLVAGRAVLSRYLVTVASNKQTNNPALVLRLEESDVEKLALDPQIGKVWRQWRKRHRGVLSSPFSFSLSSPFTIPDTPTTPSIAPTSPMTPLMQQTEPTPTTSPTNSAKVEDNSETVYLTSRENKKMRPISVDNGVLSLDDSDNDDDKSTLDSSNARGDGISIPLTPATIQERRKSRPWSFHGQRFSLYESFAAMAGSPWEQANRTASPICEQQEQPIVAAHNSEHYHSLARPDTPVETESPATPRSENADPNHSTSDLNPISPSSYYFSQEEESNDTLARLESPASTQAETEMESKVSSTNALEPPIELKNALNSLNESSAPAKSESITSRSVKSEETQPIILLASAPLSYSVQKPEIFAEPSSTSSNNSSSSKRQSAISQKFKRGIHPSLESSTVPGFSTSVPSEKVRKYIWVSNQRLDGDSSSSSKSGQDGGYEDERDVSHVSFERLLNSDVTYTLNLTPDRLREAKPFYGGRMNINASTRGESSTQAHSSSNAVAATSQTKQSFSKSSLGSPVMLASTRPKTARDESVRATAGATQELMKMLRQSPSGDDLSDGGESLVLRESPEHSVAQSYRHKGGGTTNATHSQVRSEADSVPVPEIPEQYRQQTQSPQQHQRQTDLPSQAQHEAEHHLLKRKPSIMNRLGFSSIATSKTPETPPLLSAHTQKPYPAHLAESVSPNTAYSSTSTGSLVGSASGINARPSTAKQVARDDLSPETQTLSSDLASFLRNTVPDEDVRRASGEKEVTERTTKIGHSSIGYQRNQSKTNGDHKRKSKRSINIFRLLKG
ncbi:hypothetical protein V1512DRAFT_261212 [Lipomyces arxii]|uniref:uncharacterized protein n=1 Tax=Lipomyces arxii TaxID=56418 RepID=UPI0034CFE093